MIGDEISSVINHEPLSVHGTQNQYVLQHTIKRMSNIPNDLCNIRGLKDFTFRVEGIGISEYTNEGNFRPLNLV